ncbi:MAG: hypothetical protein Unbinned664contig1000_5 [Prokaryotic dsDNA virus sp.]|nr:MAG: hypothetical protein Unbinned664contig1000_5 [Prokaryotic dsDNA virus sp.]
MAHLNYDPSDPDKMRLPSGVSCGDCANHGWCKKLFGCKPTNTRCDWSPSRLSQVKVQP